MKSFPAIVISLLIPGLFMPLPARDDAAQRLYQQGIFQMEAMGDFPAAIALFERLVKEHPGNKSLASRALLMTGRCYEKLGKAEAEKAYNRILEDYGDQREVVNEARVRLMALAERTRPAGHTDIITRRIWQGPEACVWAQPSHDEKYIVFTDWSTDNLALLDLETSERRQLMLKGSGSTERAYIPFFSPDGKHIVFSWDDDEKKSAELRLLNIETGEVRVLLEGDFLAFTTLAWSHDGKSIALKIVNLDRGYFLGLYNMDEDTLEILRSFNEYFYPVKTAFSPDGKYLAYEHFDRTDHNWLNIYTVDLETKEHYKLIAHPSENIVFDWTPEGTELVFISNRTGINALYTIPVENGRAAGDVVMLKTDVSQAITPIRITAGGSLYYGIDSGGRDVYTAAFNPYEPEPFGPPQIVSRRFQGSNRAAAWSNDGRYIAYVASRHQRLISYSNAVVIHDIPSGNERELMLDVITLLDFIKWLPDNESVIVSAIYLVDLQRSYALFILNTLTGEVTDIIKGGLTGNLYNPVWPGDGKHMYFLRGIYGDPQIVFAKRNMETRIETVLFDPAQSTDGLGDGLPMFHLAGSTDRNMLVFSRRSNIERRSDLFLIDLDKDVPEPVGLLTINDPEIISRPFSFKGNQIWFTKWRLDDKNIRRNPELWSFDMSTRESHKIVAIPDDIFNFSLHPDGKSFLFNMGPYMKPCEIWAIDNLFR
jgi:Tol biopolymer transport system component